MGTTSSHNISSSKWTESITLQGETEAKAELVTDLNSGTLVKSSFEIHGENFESYTAEGEELVSPIQIVNPIQLSAFLSTKIKNEHQIIDASFVTLSSVNITLSMQNYALLTAIASSTVEAWTTQKKDEEDSQSSFQRKPLTPNMVEEIQLMSSKLENRDLETASTDTGVELIFRDGASSAHYSTAPSVSSIKKRVLSVKLTLPETVLTVVNDLQGIDDALFKVTVQSCVWGVDASVDLTQKDNTMFHVQANANFLADYFDSHTNLWEPFLLNSWEIDFKARRGKKKGESRSTTTVDIENHPCQISFSEQMIISLRGAASMWTLYSDTTRKAMDILSQKNKDEQTISFVKAKASYSARAMTTTMPYGIDNRTGYSITFDVKKGKQEAPNNSTTFFNFSLPKGDGVGVGGFRLYGQDSISKKSIDIFIDGECVHFDHIDDELNRSKKAHELGNTRFVFTDVIKTGKTTIIQISSFMSVINETNLKFSLSFKVEDKVEFIGNCSRSKYNTQCMPQSYQSTILGIPVASLERAYHGDNSDDKNIFMQLSIDNNEPLIGEINLFPMQAYYKIAKSKSSMVMSEMVLCSATAGDKIKKEGSMVVKIGCKVTIIHSFPFVELFIQPRMLLQNSMCINVFAKTLMSNIYKNGVTEESSSKKDATIYRLEPFESLEIYSPQQSIFFVFKCADVPVGETKTGWNGPEWVEIPLSIDAQMEEEIDCYFPFVDKNGDESSFKGGSTFFISEIPNNSGDLLSKVTPKTRVVTINSENLGIDHTGDFLFERCSKNSRPFTLTSFSSTFKKRRVTLLPASSKSIRLFQLSTGRRSQPFCIDDITFANGGTDSTPIYWGDSTESGFFAYKKFPYHNESKNCTHNQLEIHIIPAIIIYNNGEHQVRVNVSHGQDLVLDKGKMSPIHQGWGEKGIMFMVEFVNLGCATAPFNISKTGLIICVVKSTVNLSPVGSVAIQTMIGRKDSRHVIKIGAVKYGNVAEPDLKYSSTPSMIGADLLRFRVRWSQMEVTFLDTSKQQIAQESDLKLEISQNSNNFVGKKSTSYARVAHMLLNRFTLDYQRVFKDDVVSTTMKKRNQARSQFAIIVHNLHLKDFTESDIGTTVLASTSRTTNFFELCIRTRDNEESIASLTTVDLLELKLANNGKVADKIILNTNEAFLWSLLDIASRTKDASMAFATTDTKIGWNDETETFDVEAIEISADEDEDETDEYGNYNLKSDIRLYAFKKARVLPTSFLLSFKRQPQTSRYQKVQNVKGARIVNYFTKKLNFTIDKAHLKFNGFYIHGVTGPPDRIIELLKAFYSSQMKKKIFTLLTSTSIDEWQQLSGRDDGEKGFIDGDILRTAGNLTGKSAGFIVKKVGQGISFGVTAGTAEVGNSIQEISEHIGAGAVGASVNSVITGIGGGVGSTVQGVGDGGSKIIKGAGKGVGQIIGGVGGGIAMTAKGVGKGVIHGDGKAVLTGIGDGAASIGNGIFKGGESVVMGVGDGVFAVGKGIFSGAKSIGMGLGDAVTGKKIDPKKANHNKQRKR